MVNQETESVDAPLTLRVLVESQKLEVWRQGILEKSYPISTSKYGLGTEPGSFKTPLGRFAVVEKIGDGAASRTVFRSRRSTGEIAFLGGEEDLILSRILWLSGQDSDNANTRERYIYIHGTNQEDQLGTPASHGCVRMANADIIELYDRIGEGTAVEILS